MNFFLKVGLKILSWIYSSLNWINKKLYEINFLKRVQLTTPVISVGNLTVGGSGKTPVIIYLVKLLSGFQKKTVVVSKNYKSKAAGIQKINLELFNLKDSKKYNSPAEFYGDEPFLIYTKTNTTVYIGPRKSDTAMLVNQNEQVDFILVDDGFQHHRLSKKVNILLMDVTQIGKKNDLLPLGRYRDPFDEYKKADIIIWTKTNWISPEMLRQIKQKVKFNRFQFDIEFFNDLLMDPFEEKIVEIDFVKNRILSFAGLANPDFFHKSVRELFMHNEIIEKNYSDHYQYNLKDIDDLSSSRSDINFYITTEKDFVKLKNIWPRDLKILVLGQRLKASENESVIYENICQFID